MDPIDQALYRHPAFLPHRFLRSIGLASFWAQNATVTIFAAITLTFCAWADHSFIITNGYGYLQHPGVLAWYLVQLVMPIAIFRAFKAATKTEKNYEEVITDVKAFKFEERVLKPMLNFIGFRTRTSRSLFALLFLLGFVGFAWNTLQNLFPGQLAPLDFWDSIHFRYGYFGSRVFKFYVDALLLPSIVHVFAGVVWTNIDLIRRLTQQKRIRLAPFDPDRCGGFRFLADLILSPTISALLLSGLAFFGVAYTHRTFDVSTLGGILLQATVLTLFYVAPTFFLKSVLVKVKKIARSEVHIQQESYYQAILSGELHGTTLRDAHEYLRYFNDISTTIDNIPDWPHLTKVSRVFGISISPALISSAISLGNLLRGLYPSLH